MEASNVSTHTTKNLTSESTFTDKVPFINALQYLPNGQY